MELNKNTFKITKFENFDSLSDDILLIKNDMEKYVKVKEPMEIIQITGALTDEDEIKKIEENITVDTSLTLNEVKRGQIIWLTVLLRKKGTESYNTQNSMGVLKVRVVDIYMGLTMLKNVIK